MAIESKRIGVIDFLRGMAIINMIIYHFLYSLVYIFGVEVLNFSADTWYPYQQYIAWSFIILSGFSINLSKSPGKNGLIVLGAAILVTIVTHVFTPGLGIKFGILHFMGVTILILAMFKNFFEALNPYIGLVLSFSAFIYIWDNGIEVFPFYDRFTQSNLFFLGFPSIEFTSSDYFPMFPWMFLFIAGFYIGRLNEVYGNPLKKYNILVPIVNTLGQNSLQVYLVHQVIIYFSLTILRNLGII